MTIRDGETNIKYLLIISIVAAVLGIGLSYYEKKMEKILEKPFTFVSQDNKVKTQDEYSILDRVSFWTEISIKYYKLGTAEFIIYPLIEEDHTFQFGYFEAYNNGEKVFFSEPVYKIADLLSFKYKNDKYIILSDYSGGAHCCFQEYIFRLDENNDLKLIKSPPTGNTTISENNLIFKNGKLYLTIRDDRFAYFHTAYAGSYFFNRYFLINGEELVESNLDFKEEYIKEAGDCKKDLDIYLDEKTIEDFEAWFPKLLCKAVNYLVIGEEGNAWEKFGDYFSKLSVIAPPRFKEDNLTTIKQEIIEKMKEPAGSGTSQLENLQE